MDALFEGLVDRLRTSNRLADSTLLEIVHSAMLDAHKKTVSEERRGLVRLHHNARFHELSIIMLECCLKVVHEEAENDFLDGRSEFEQALASLLEQQALMQKKLEDLENIIAEKDRELMRKKQNAAKQKLSFEVIGNDMEKTVKGTVKHNSSSQCRVLNMGKDDESMIDRLESSIEQELSKIEMKLENERDTFTGNLQKLKQESVDGAIDVENDGKYQLHGLYNREHLLSDFEEMISDVSILKEDIKFYFRKMESSKSLFKMNLEDYQLRMNMERELSNLLIKSFIQEANCNHFKLDSIGAAPVDKTTKLQSTEEAPEEAAVLREEIDKVVVSSMINDWNNEMESIAIYHPLRNRIENVLFGEVIRYLTEFSSCSTTVPLSKERDTVVDTLKTNDWTDNKQATEIENFLEKDINCFILSEIMKDLTKHISATPTISCNTKNFDNEVEKDTINNKVLEEINTAFSKILENFLDVETKISSRINANNKRLEDFNQQLNILKEEIILLKKKELLYQNAFHRRCYVLHTAEAEVDLLGDEVEFLLGLINKSYKVLDRHSPELQYHSEVMEIVNLLKNEVEAGWQE